MSIFKGNSWLKNISVLITGTVIGQIIPIALQPVLRRLFTPEEFGTFAVFASIYGMISVGSSLRYDMAINNPDSDQESYNLLWLSQLVNTTVSVAALLVLLILMMVGFEGISLTTTMIIGVPLAILFSGAFRSINYWFIRKEMFSISSRNKVYRRLAQGIAQLGLGFMKIPSALITADVFGHLANVGSAIIGIRKSVSELSMPTWSDLKTVAEKHREFALVSTGPALLNAFCLLFPSIIISEKFGLMATGQYDLSRTLLMIPMALVGVSVSQVVLQQTNKLKNENAARNKFYRQLLLILVGITIPIPPLLYFFGVDVFQIAFGDGWNEAALVATILSISYGIKTIVSPFSMILVAFERLRIMAVWQIGYALFIGVVYLMKVETFMDLIWIFTIGETLIYLVYALIIFSAARSGTAKT